MPRKIILHAGFHKTGTTTLQNTLRQNREALKPYVGLRLRWHLRELVTAAKGYSTWLDPLTLLGVQDSFFQVLDDMPGMPRRILIISCEELLGHLPGRGDLKDYSAASILLYSYWEILQQRFPNAEKVIYFSTRAPAPWLESAYWEHVKSSDMTMDVAEFKDTYHQAADLEAIVAEVASRVPAQVFHCPLEDCLEGPLGPADPVLDMCELPDDVRAALLPVAPANQRLPQNVLNQLLQINRSEPNKDKRKAAKDLLLSRGAI